jgi:hypothetical protein
MDKIGRHEFKLIVAHCHESANKLPLGGVEEYCNKKRTNCFQLLSNTGTPYDKCQPECVVPSKFP